MADKMEEKEIKKEESSRDLVREFEENPFDPESKGPDEVVRLFYMNDAPVLPVISKRGILLGILTKDSVIAELSDLERVKNQKSDQLITKLAKKMPLDDLLPIVGNIKEFVVINIFGEICGKWSRLELFAACEQGRDKKAIQKEVEKQQEDQILEWMIYLILEHIPRALYAVNEKGKTIFYNSHFEDIFIKQMSKDVDIGFIEKSFGNSKKNSFFYRNKGKEDIYFFNKDMKIYYEKIPLKAGEKNAGFLIFCDREWDESSSGTKLPELKMEGLSLKEKIDSFERMLIVDSIKENKHNITEIAKKLKITKKALESRIKKYGIDANPSQKLKKNS